MKRIKTKIIKWCEKEASLREGVKTGLEMSFVSPDDIQCSPFFHCKDYLQDTILAYVNLSKKEIYGFSYNPIDDPAISLTKTKIMVTNSQDFQFSLKVLPCLDLLHQIESEIKIPKTRIFYCKNPPKKYLRSGVWLFQGHSRWIHSPPMISLYSLLIRVGLNHTIGNNFWTTIDSIIEGKIEPVQSVDKFRLQDSKPGIQRIIKFGDKNIFYKNIKDNYPSSVAIRDVHNRLGIVSFSKGISKELVPYWHRSES